MAKLVETKIARFVSITDFNGDIVEGLFDDFLTLSGMLCIYESDNNPKKKFFYFYANEPNNLMQKCFFCSPGDYTEVEPLIAFQADHTYLFVEGNFIPDDEKELLWLNILAR